MSTRVPYLDELLAALGQPGCAFCRLLDATTDRYIDAVLFEMVNDVKVRDELNAARGLCGRHAPLLVRTGGALGSATMMQGVLKVLLRQLDAAEVEGVAPSRLRGLMRVVDPGGTHPAVERLAGSLAPQAPCPACAIEATFAAHYTATLLAQIMPDNPIAATYRDSDGLCLPHFRMVVGRALPGPALNALVAAQRAVWERLNGELEEFLRKSDYRFQKEPFGAERDSWQRAISAVSGQYPAHRDEG
mgnify:CR=1 FL=1